MTRLACHLVYAATFFRHLPGIVGPALRSAPWRKKPQRLALILAVSARAFVVGAMHLEVR